MTQTESVSDDLHDVWVGDYWAAISQAIPVISFAIVIEARAISTNWVQGGTPKGVRVVQSIIWASILIVLAFAETRALAGVRGKTQPGWLPDTVEMAISGGMGVLVLSPVIELLVRANPEGTARILTLYPIARLRLWLLDRDVARSMREIDWLYLDGFATFAEAREFLLRHEADVDGLEQAFAEKRGSMSPDERKDWEARIQMLKNELLTSKASWSERRDQRVAQFAAHRAGKAEYAKRRQERPLEWRTEVDQERKRLAAHFATFSAVSPMPNNGQDDLDSPRQGTTQGTSDSTMPDDLVETDLNVAVSDGERLDELIPER